ncbi:MAG: peroxide stress protein YaaA [Myxococcota bacterium]|nr:peroxide stress protein YaaA [Myxococcota bacterium]
MHTLPGVLVYIVLSPAKKLDWSPGPNNLEPTIPNFLPQIEELSKATRKLSRQKLQAMMGISEQLADLNHERFQNFSLPFEPGNSKPAIFAFNGDTYIGFDVSKLTAEDLDWAQSRLGILSGFYGLLRPLDLMQPYRLEMGTKMATRRGKNLYAFWGSLIRDRIQSCVADHKEQSLVNLASNEYFKAVQNPALDLEVITPVFRDVKDGKSRTLFLFAKRARGAMARWAIQHRIERAEDLKEFDEGGYRFQAESSTPDRWVFERPQPPPVR